MEYPVERHCGSGMCLLLDFGCGPMHHSDPSEVCTAFSRGHRGATRAGRVTEDIKTMH